MLDNFPKQLLSIGVFLIITFAYFAIKYANPPNSVYFIIYGLSIILSQLFINLRLTTALCGAGQWSTTIFVTLIPWILVFGALCFFLYKFPGWLKPFSNTFGYMMVSSNIKTIFNDILKKKTESSGDLAKIYNDSNNQDLLINEIPPDDAGFNIFYTSLKANLKPNLKDDDPLIINLRNLVKLKNIVAEFMWYALTGTLTTMVSYNYIIESKCALSVQEMENNSKKAQEDIQNDVDILNADPSIYRTS